MTPRLVGPMSSSSPPQAGRNALGICFTLMNLFCRYLHLIDLHGNCCSIYAVGQSEMESRRLRHLDFKRANFIMKNVTYDFVMCMNNNLLSSCRR